MALIEIKLNSFLYRFRPLPWAEELRLKPSRKFDQRRAVLARALVDISGLAVSAAEAEKVVQSLPEAILWRIWIIYSGSLPVPRYMRTANLFEAPDTTTHRRELEKYSKDQDTMTHQQNLGVPNRYKAKERDIPREIFENARKEQRLVTAASY